MGEGFADFFVSLEPEWVAPTSVGLTVDTTGPAAVFSEAFHLALHPIHSFKFLAGFALGTKHDARVAFHFPLDLCGKNEVGIVFTIKLLPMLMLDLRLP